MVNMMKWAAQWVADQAKTHTSESVRYYRDAQFVDIDASIGQTDQDYQEVEGVVVTVTRADWIFDTADLVLNGSATLPEVGDLIVHVIGTKTFTYKVLPMEGEEKHWRYTEHLTKSRIRAHTKLVNES